MKMLEISSKISNDRLSIIQEDNVYTITFKKSTSKVQITKSKNILEIRKLLMYYVSNESKYLIYHDGNDIAKLGMFLFNQGISNYIINLFNKLSELLPKLNLNYKEDNFNDIRNITLNRLVVGSKVREKLYDEVLNKIPDVDVELLNSFSVFISNLIHPYISTLISYEIGRLLNEECQMYVENVNYKSLDFKTIGYMAYESMYGSNISNFFTLKEYIINGYFKPKE